MQIGDIVQVKIGLSKNMDGEIVAEFKRKVNYENYSQHEYPEAKNYWIVKLRSGNEIMVPENFLEIIEQSDFTNPVGQ